MSKDIQKMYQNRFNDNHKQKKNAIWKEICEYITKFAGGGIML